MASMKVMKAMKAMKAETTGLKTKDVSKVAVTTGMSTKDVRAILEAYVLHLATRHFKRGSKKYWGFVDGVLKEGVSSGVASVAVVLRK